MYTKSLYLKTIGWLLEYSVHGSNGGKVSTPLTFLLDLLNGYSTTNLIWVL